MEQDLHLGDLTIATHFFMVTPKVQSVERAVWAWAERFIEYEQKWDPFQKRNVKVIGRVWGGRQGNNYRYPITLLKDFYQFLDRRGIPRDKFKLIELPVYEPAKASFTLVKEYVPYGYQEEGIKFTHDTREEKHPSSLLMMPTGSGKTVTLLAYSAQLGLRFGMMVAPAHFESWVKYFAQYLDVAPERVYQVRGGKAIRKLFALAENDEFDYDIVLFSLTTFNDFMMAYDEDPEACVDVYGGTPFEIWAYARLGGLNSDEAHERFFQVYTLHTFLHGPFHLALSATMIHKDPATVARQQEIYPQNKRFDKIPLPRHTKHINLGYYFDNFERDKIQLTFPRRTTFSQAAFEGSILKNKKTKANLLAMVERVFEVFFLERRKPGERMGLYFYRVDTVEAVLAHLRMRFPSLDIRRYVEEDELKMILEPDAFVTTIGKAGTGVDVPKLITVYSFVNIDSWQSNVQLLGRLRAPKEGESEKFFIQGYPALITKLEKYKMDRDRLFANRTSGRVDTFYNANI